MRSRRTPALSNHSHNFWEVLTRSRKNPVGGILGLRCILHFMIRKTPKGYVLLSKTTGKKLGGPYKTRNQALKRERQVQFFKRRKAA